eukprot:1333955-Amorphochlora_amoeboformis.AAC.1
MTGEGNVPPDGPGKGDKHELLHYTVPSKKRLSVPADQNLLPSPLSSVWDDSNFQGSDYLCDII